MFSKSKHRAVIKYADFVSKEEPDLVIMDIEDDLFEKKGQPINFIYDITRAEERLNCILSNKGISFEELIKNMNSGMMRL